MRSSVQLFQITPPPVLPGLLQRHGTQLTLVTASLEWGERGTSGPPEPSRCDRLPTRGTEL